MIDNTDKPLKKMIVANVLASSCYQYNQQISDNISIILKMFVPPWWT